MTATSSVLQAALAHHQQGRLDEAEALYATVLQSEPNHVEALYLLGLVAHQRGRHEETVALLRHAIALAPHVAAYHNTLGDALRLRGRLDEAEAALRRARQLDPASADVRSNLALVLHLRQQWPESLGLMLDLVAPPPPARTQADEEAREIVWHDGAYLRFRDLIVEATRQLAQQPASHPLHGDARMRALLLRLCNDDAISTQRLADALLGPVVATTWFAALEQVAKEHRDPFDVAPDAAHTLIAEPFLHAALPRMVVAHEGLERVLTALRESLLRRAFHHGIASDENASACTFLCALAQQCFANEYSYLESTREREMLQGVREALEEALELATDPSALHSSIVPALALLACYTPLSALTNASRLLADRGDSPGADAWSRAIAPVIQQQVADALLERQLADALPCLTPITDTVSQVVREMYEENPYPRWVSAEHPAPIAPFEFIRELQVAPRVAQQSTHADPRLANGTSIAPKGEADILVAGCGTGRQPLQIAMQFAPARVLAIDLSRTSLAYAQRMAAKFGVSNITFAQADLLELRMPERSFDIISCSGVLHHLADPIAGWRVLLRHLAPGGIMKIGLYATRARRSVDAARALVQRRQYSTSADDIRQCRRAILDLPTSDDARTVASFLDFFSISGCRDLFMHVQERSYTALELADTLGALQLRFLGFQLDRASLAEFQRANPRPASLFDLTAWDGFEAEHPDTFAGMYQFWCARG